jgi:hypothetical protein
MISLKFDFEEIVIEIGFFANIDFVLWYQVWIDDYFWFADSSCSCWKINSESDWCSFVIFKSSSYSGPFPAAKSQLTNFSVLINFAYD